MKRLVPLTLAVFFTSSLLASCNMRFNNTGKKRAPLEFKVIRVEGNITYQASGDEMKRGDSFPEKEPLVFKSALASAAVIDSKLNRVILRPPSKKGKAYNLFPALNNVTPRAGAILNLIDFKAYFSDTLFLPNELKVTMNPEIFNIDDDHFLYLEYDYYGEEINKRIKVKDSTMTIYRDGLFNIDGQPINPLKYGVMKMKLRDETKGQSTEIATFTFSAPKDLKAPKEEVRVIMSAYGDIRLKKKETTEAILAYLSQFYGKINKRNMRNWMGVY